MLSQQLLVYNNLSTYNCWDYLIGLVLLHCFTSPLGEWRDNSNAPSTNSQKMIICYLPVLWPCSTKAYAWLLPYLRMHPDANTTAKHAIGHISTNSLTRELFIFQLVRNWGEQIHWKLFSYAQQLTVLSLRNLCIVDNKTIFFLEYRRNGSIYIYSPEREIPRVQCTHRYRPKSASRGCLVPSVK